ncbi:SecDF P1 head subdomain-containing protein [Pelagibacterium halotolerans]|uniref:SecDF P1 head subdomain-containing protein n=1 Tax=Pelagibacterium halotolerans TaxID=531813 RepID=UPI00384FE6AA
MKPFLQLFLLSILAATPLKAADPHKTAAIELAAIEATVARGVMSDGAAIEVRLDTQSTLALAAFTETHMDQVVAVYVRDRLLVAPVVRAPITGGVLQISGFQEEESAEDIAERLEAGEVIRIVAED